MPLRQGLAPERVSYTKGSLAVVYESSKCVLVPRVTRRNRATLYDRATLGSVAPNETFNFVGIHDVSFRNHARCESMTYLQMRPWVYDIERCTSKNRSGMHGHSSTANFMGCRG